jgi:4,5-dihydroxyphthalate decarboxylase
MAGPKLSVSLEHYDRTVPLLEGKVTAEGLDMEVIRVSNADRREQRYLDGFPWDVCEMSICPFLMAKFNDGAPITGIPVFHRRFLVPSHMYVNTNAGIRSPKDLAGKRVGLVNPVLALSVWARGDLEHEYGVPMDQVTWVAGGNVPVPYPPAGVKLEQIPEGKNVNDMLVAGEIDAYFSPMLPPSFEEGVPQVARLFPDSRAEDKAYYKRNGFYPIIHIMAITNKAAEEHPHAAMSLYNALEEAQEIGFRYYKDPWWSHLAWTHMSLLEQRDTLGPEAWANGIAHNRTGLDRFLQYMAEQGLLSRRLTIEEIVAESTLGT